MTEQQTPVLEQSAPQARVTPPPTPEGPNVHKKKKKKKSRLKLVILIAVIAVVVVAVVLLLYFLVFKKSDDKGNAMTDFVSRGSIQSIVEGYGTTKAKDSATVTPTSGGEVLEVFVSEGAWVEAGQQLYSMDDSAARKAVADAEEAVVAAQKAVTNAQKDLQSIYDAAKDLSITAPHAGKLMDVATLKAGDDVSEGQKIATLVNDTKLRLALYFSYAYEGQISVGQQVQISVPSIMGSLPGKVDQINYVRRVVPEGSVTFEVVFVLDNPGTLTEGMDASVSMSSAGGAPIYPYENGKLAYYETTQISAKVKGPVERTNLINYGDVKAGQLLVQLGAEDNLEEISAKETALTAAQDKLTEAVKTVEDKQKEMDNYNAVAPISGTVISCSLYPGLKVESGQGITIADTSVMTVEIQIDERNMRYVKAGMMVNIDQWGTPFFGILESVSQTAQGENGVASFPGIVKVDNPGGTLMTGMYVNYNFVASQSEDCLTVPVQAVKYASFSGIDGAGGAEGDPGMLDPGMVDPGMLDPGMVDPGMEGGEAPPEEDLVEGAEPPVLPEEGGDSAEPMPAPEGEISIMPMPQRASAGAAVMPLRAVAVPMPGGKGGMGGMGGMGGGGETTGTIVFVKASTPPENAILEPDPAWECPKGFYAVPVTVGLADNTRVEILSGLNEGDEVFIGYETQSANMWG